MNRRDILKAVLATPFALFATKSVSAEEPSVEPEVDRTDYTIKAGKVVGITGSMFENHQWRGPNGEYMKVEMLARTRDSYDYFFAVYPENLSFSYYKRFEISGQLIGLDYGRAQQEYERQVAQAIAKYYAGLPTDRGLSIEEYA